MLLNKLLKSIFAILFGAGAFSLLVSAPTASAAEVVVAAYGGSFQNGQIKALFTPYGAATGTKVIGTTGTSYPKVKAMVTSGNITWDVISAESPAFANEAKDGLLAPIDYSVVKA
ncbi:hypothetical protein COJ85_27200, partial [Bacillus sp. AFS076308]